MIADRWRRFGVSFCGLAMVAVAGRGQETKVLRARYSVANPETIRSSTLRGQEMPLHLVDGVSFTAVLDHFENDPLNGIVWRGHLKEEPGWVVLAVHEGAIAGVVSTPQANYRIRYAGGRVHLIEQVELLEPSGRVNDAVIPDIEPAFAATAAENPPQAADGAGPTILDLMVVYTKRSMKRLNREVNTGINNNKRAMISQIKLMIAIINQVFENSGVDARARLVKIKQIKFKASGDASADLDKIQNPADGKADKIPIWRDRYGADFVVAVLEDLGEDTGGIAYLVPPTNPVGSEFTYSLVRFDLLWWLAGAHEVAHNMGQGHDKANNETPLPWLAHRYSLGWRNPRAGWVSVMAYNLGCSSCKWRIPHFSDPKIKWRGASTGIDPYPLSCGDGEFTGPKCGDKTGTNKANVAKSIRKSLAYYEAFRPCRTSCNSSDR